MKPQDFAFFAILIGLLIYRRGRHTWLAGLSCLVFSALLLWLFDNRFTMQRLTWYAATFFLIYTLRALIISQKSQS